MFDRSEITRRDLLRGAAAAPLALNKISESLEKELAASVQCEVLYYHEVYGRKLNTDIAARLDQGKTPISVEDLYYGLRGDDGVVLPKDIFTVTFDDGFLSQYTQGLPVLERFREQGIFVPVALFAMTRFEGLELETVDIPDKTVSFRNNVYSYMNKGQLLEFLSLGYSMQNITNDHVNITAMSGRALDQQVGNAEKTINDLWAIAGRERSVRAFAYPFGASRGRVDYIADQGFDLAFGTSRSMYHSYQNRFTLGRYGA